MTTQECEAEIRRIITMYYTEHPEQKPKNTLHWGMTWFFLGWDCIQLGFHVSLRRRNVEVHIPFGFFRIGNISTEVYGFSIHV